MVFKLSLEFTDPIVDFTDILLGRLTVALHWIDIGLYFRKVCIVGQGFQCIHA